MMPPATGYTHEAAYDAGHLQVDSIHEIYYAQYGKKDGLPVIFLHGGPGGNTSPVNTTFFDPAVYRVVVMDQRGVGRSRPRNELRANTTRHLSDDIERLRAHLGVDRWHMVFGGSWGSLLGLFYTQAHPERVGSLVLRGVFAARRSELRGPDGAAPASALFFPAEWEAFLAHLTEDERHGGDPMAAYHARITSADPAVALAAARAWNRWELCTGTLRPDPDAPAKLDDPDWCLTHALFESHYLFQNAAWMDDGELLRPANMAKIKDIPGAIVQGRYDMVCPPKTAWEVHMAWPKSSFHWVVDAGHSPYEPGMVAALVQVCDELAKL
ncbi:putative prolyl aminopeptidase [Rosellinia necatrix]|uniref:Proline iminopeptidase n=1 Tax=Rosellinia necatrix TaxID=77044 RepID=A0A1W2TQ25_ROSNE|nr:putative prolyl aminopeptidase [Rosellinia necatrix]